MIILPKVGTRGLWKTEDGFSLPVDVPLECVAVRSADDLYFQGTDLFAEIYQPAGLDRARYEADLERELYILTLHSNTGKRYYVPNTTLVKFPDTNAVEYKRLVVSVDLGQLPNDVAVDHVVADMQQRAGDLVGTVTEAKLHTLDLSGVITQEEHEQLEAARLANIEQSDTLLSKNIRLTEENDALRERLRVYEQIFIDSGMVEE